MKEAINLLVAGKCYLELEKGTNIYDEIIDKKISEIDKALEILMNHQ